ncbi:MAG TPA: hypothetical protein VE422_15750 [Terriglobia bacterium]|nr:hypothetical protein [Terriglobia bacterium]
MAQLITELSTTQQHDDAIHEAIRSMLSPSMNPKASKTATIKITGSEPNASSRFRTPRQSLRMKSVPRLFGSR